jgi:hypothetical protein
MSVDTINVWQRIVSTAGVANAISESNNMWSVNIDENKVLFLVD